MFKRCSMDYSFLDDKVVICNNDVKNNILMQKKLLNITFFTREEFLKNFYFDYDYRAIYYLMKKYNYKYEVAVNYIENMYFLLEEEYSNSKLNNLLNLKREINSLLIF